jgi:hypothetical protein
MTLPQFWQGFIMFPVVMVLTILVWAFFRKQWDSMRAWYKGLPPIRWIGITLIALGLKMLTGRNCGIMRANGRIWFSPHAPYFEDKDVVK